MSATADSGRQAPFTAGYRRWLLTLAMAVTAFGYVDRVILQTLGQAIKEDLQLSDLQLGLVTGMGFAILYSVLGLPVARLAERRNRVNIVAFSAALFSVMSVLCASATNALHLFLFRVGVGLGEAGVQAPLVSLLSDHVPAERRGGAMTMMKLGAPVGAVFGSVAGGWIAFHYGWRVALLSVSAPGLLVALLFKLSLREPQRGLFDQTPGSADDETPSVRAVVRTLLAHPEFVHMLIGLALTTMALHASGAFIAPFFIRVHQLSLAEAGVYFGIMSGAATTIGLAIAGFGIDRLSRLHRRWYALLPAIGLTCSAPLYLLAYWAPRPQIALLAMGLGAVCLLTHNIPTLVAFQNMVGPRMRATAAFLFFFTSTLVGIGFGPALLGLASDVFAQASFAGGDFATTCLSGAAAKSPCSAASADGLRYALSCSVFIPLWAAFHYFAASRRIEQASQA